jgi:hypothetical protein
MFSDQLLTCLDMSDTLPSRETTRQEVTLFLKLYDVSAKSNPFK